MARKTIKKHLKNPPKVGKLCTFGGNNTTKMDEIIGRLQEINKLKEIKNKKEASLLAVYGRRRIGKTFLIRNHFQNEIIFEITGLYKGAHKEQLENFKNELEKRINTSNTKKNKELAFSISSVGIFNTEYRSKEETSYFY